MTEHYHAENRPEEPMESRTVVIEKGNRTAALEFLRPLAGEVEHPTRTCVCCMDDDIDRTDFDKVHQNPGSFIHNFAVRQMSVEEVVEVAEQFNVFTSHEGCGAAGLVHGLITQDEAARGDFEAFLGKELVKQLLAGAPDELGIAFSQEIARRAGKEYRHLKVNRVEAHGHAAHSAAIAIIDLADAFHGASVAFKGAYVIDSTRDVLKSFSLENAVSEIVTYGPLAEAIAHGGHSHVKAHEIFTICIVTDDEDAAFAQQAFDAIQEKIATEDLGEKLQVMLFQKNDVLPQAV